MFHLTRSTVVFALGILGCALSAPAQEQPAYRVDDCVKVRDGKGLEYAGYLRDVSTKLARVRLDAGIYSLFVIAQAVTPAGRSARCDYHIVFGYVGFPKEPRTPEQTEADMKTAGIAMTREQMIAKRDELSYLVGVDIWRARDGVGASAKGAYARLNYYKIKSGMAGEWVDMESKGWKPLAEAVAKQTPGMAWSSATLAMPGGESLPYNAMTVDSFPSWEAMGKGIPARAIWEKVHPDMDFTAYIDRLGTIVERPRIDVVKLVEVMHAR